MSDQLMAVFVLCDCAWHGYTLKTSLFLVGTHDISVSNVIDKKIWLKLINIGFFL